jgi:hypothetical protein
MKVQLLSVAGDHLLADNAMHPMAPGPTRPAALIRLAGKIPRRCPALLNAPSGAHSGASNCFFYDDFSVVSAAVLPEKAQPPLIVDANAVLPFAIAF